MQTVELFKFIGLSPRTVVDPIPSDDSYIKTVVELRKLEEFSSRPVGVDVDEQSYNALIIDFLKLIGFSPKSKIDEEKVEKAEEEAEKARGAAENTRGSDLALPSQADLLHSKYIKYLFDQSPTNIRDEETKHLIMVCYTSDGQAHFVVCCINQYDIHIRVRTHNFIGDLKGL